MFSLAAAAAAAVACPAARAFYTVPGGTYTFTTPVKTTPSNPGITFAPPVLPERGFLTGTKLIFNNLNYGGTVDIGNLPSNPTATASLNGTLSFDFGTVPTTSVTTQPVTAILSTSTVAPGNFIIPTVSGPFAPTSIFIPMTSPALQAYFTGGASINVSFATFSITPNTLLTSYPNTFISGSFDVEYQYDVPSPLPIVGAAAAFAHSRRLRRRIKARRA